MNATFCIGAAIAAIGMLVPLTGCAQKNSNRNSASGSPM